MMLFLLRLLQLCCFSSVYQRLNLLLAQPPAAYPPVAREAAHTKMFQFYFTINVSAQLRIQRRSKIVTVQLNGEGCTYMYIVQKCLAVLGNVFPLQIVKTFKSLCLYLLYMLVRADNPFTQIYGSKSSLKSIFTELLVVISMMASCLDVCM